MKASRIGLAGAVAALSMALCAPAALAQVRDHGIKHKLTGDTATNWSGYTVDASNATFVTGSWTVGTAVCSRKETGWSSPWVGIDGDVSSTVEQTGTDSDCSYGTPYYYAWWEMYPKGTVVISSITPRPGDSMTGTVDYIGNDEFTLTLTDNTTNLSYTTTQSSTSAPRNSVEWIVEGPSSGTLANFGSVPFTGDQAAFGGPDESLSAFGTSANAITMVTRKGAVRAQPGPVNSSGGFTDTWVSS